MRPFRLVLIALSTTLGLTGALRAEDMVPVPAAGTGIGFSTSISINAPMQATDSASQAEEETAQRRALYVRAMGECDVLLEAVAQACTITSVSVSTQVNLNPGQPPYLYATANIAMQVELK